MPPKKKGEDDKDDEGEDQGEDDEYGDKIDEEDYSGMSDQKLTRS